MSDLSEPFTDMAARINLNAEEGFGGAFVIVPPGEDAKPIQLLMLNVDGNTALFLGTLQTMVQMALQEIADQEQAGGSFGTLRR